MNDELFIEKSKKIHGNIYDYSKVEYKKSNINVTIICKIHGDFKLTPNSHLSKKSGCQKCSRNKKSETQIKNNNNNFINNAIKIHGDKYDYSKIEYINSNTHINILCKIHGEFPQLPDVHISGCGCQKCGNNFRYDTATFIEKAQQIHGDNYDYSKVEYKKSNINVTIICKIHGDFKLTPNSHLSEKRGCQKCSRNKISETQIKNNKNNFINNAIKIHGDKYDYSKIEYINSNTHINILCKIHNHEFPQIPNSHLQGSGCPKCSKNYTMTQLEFIEKAQQVHIDCTNQPLFNYELVNFVNNKTPIKILCKIHDEFKQLPFLHIKGHGCKKCSRNKVSETQIKNNNNNFINNAIKIHGDKYDYSKVDYKGSSINVKIICKIHGEFEKSPDNHTHKTKPQGCQGCQKKKQYSQLQIQWLHFIQLKNNITIKHAENCGEFLIPNTNYKADGYCEETNTIYEFHGDYWHGNPKKFLPTEINKTINKPFGELYKNTLEKEQKIQDLGYNLVVIWEYEWNKINKSMRILQRKFKSIHK